MAWNEKHCAYSYLDKDESDTEEWQALRLKIEGEIDEKSGIKFKGLIRFELNKLKEKNAELASIQTVKPFETCQIPKKEGHTTFQGRLDGLITTLKNQREL